MGIGRGVFALEEAGAEYAENMVEGESSIPARALWGYISRFPSSQ